MEITCVFCKNKGMQQPILGLKFFFFMSQVVFFFRGFFFLGSPPPGSSKKKVVAWGVFPRFTEVYSPWPCSSLGEWKE